MKQRQLSLHERELNARTIYKNALSLNSRLNVSNWVENQLSETINYDLWVDGNDRTCRSRLQTMSVQLFKLNSNSMQIYREVKRQSYFQVFFGRQTLSGSGYRIARPLSRQTINENKDP